MQKPNRLSKNNKGVTLVEVIAIIAVLSVVMGAITGFMITGARMSAQVSGGATAGMREQTAVEYINQRLWEMDASALESIDQVPQENPTSPVLYRALAFQLDEERRVQLTTQDGNVTYNNVVLCRGEIYFQEVDQETNTVTYVLNGVTHVVHLRKQPPESPQS